jgi:protein O-mannosyl-transferase
MKNEWRSLGWCGALMVLLTIVAYLPAIHAGFIWDDDAYVTENPLLTAPDGLKRIWFSAHHESQYFPLVFTTLRFERKLWGLNPMGYHVVNVLLHSLNALLVWAVLRRLPLPGAWLAAAIWAVHPVNVESVAWITELKNTQSTLFYLVALLAWMKFADEETVRPWRFYALALLLQALALFSKTTACTLPAAMALVLWVRNRPLGWRRIVQLVPFLVMGVTMGLVSLWWETHLSNYHKEYSAVGSLDRVLIASRAVWFYAMKLAWPTKLTFSYQRWQINPRDPLQYAWLIGCAAVALVLWWRRNNWGRGCAAAIAFFVAALSPMLGFIPLYTFRYSFVADHYQYVASMGLIALFVAAVSLQAAALRLSFGVRRTLSSLLLLVLGTLTWQQYRVYRDLDTLWRDTLAKNPGSWMAHNNLGLELFNAGDAEGAIREYRASLQIKSDHVEAYNNLGFALASQGKVAEAIAEYEAALRIDPDSAAVHDNLGNALASQGRFAEAIAQYRAALRIKPDYAQAIYNMANTLVNQGRISEAIAAYQAALRVTPNVAEIHSNLGSVLAGQGRFAEAAAEYQTALRINPNLVVVHNNLGTVLANQGKTAKAIAEYAVALQLNPDYTEAHYNLGVALEQVGMAQEAIGHFEQALRINPDYAEARNRLARLRAVQ